MANYPRRFCNAITVADKAVTLGENVVLCIKGVGSLPVVFNLLFNVDDPAAQDTYPVYVSTRNSGNVHLVDSALNIVTYGDLLFNSVYTIAKVNVCGSNDCCSNQQTTYFQVLNLAVEGGTAANFF